MSDTEINPQGYLFFLSLVFYFFAIEQSDWQGQLKKTSNRVESITPGTSQKLLHKFPYRYYN